jgi:G3E family GTPase
VLVALPSANAMQLGIRLPLQRLEGESKGIDPEPGHPERVFIGPDIMLPKKIPVTVITGFLGAGKTTLVNHLLAQHTDANIGVIVNEFGEVGIDGELIVADEEALIEIRNGCICCTVRTDLVAGVKMLLERSDINVNRLIIETSGLADPAPVLQTFLADTEVLTRVQLESVVTLVDAAHVQRQIGNDIAREQIAFADLIVLNKVDLLEADDIIPLERHLRAINPTAAILRTKNAEMAADTLFGVHRFSLPNLLAIEPGILQDAHDHEHDSSITSCAVETTDALDPDRFTRWINQLVQQEGQHIMRMKGVLNFHGEARQFYFHSVHMLLASTPGKRWQSAEVRQSRFVFIGRHLDNTVLPRGFLDCVHESARVLSPNMSMNNRS